MMFGLFVTMAVW